MDIWTGYRGVIYHNLIDKHLEPLLQGVSEQQKKVLRSNPKGYFFYANSYNDYLSARVLLNNEIFIPGCVMANTFIEKILKAHILFEDYSFKKKIHKSADLLNYLCGMSPIMRSLISQPFVEFLEKTYATRYYDALEEDYSLYISYRRVLAELDYAAFILFNTISFTFPPNSLPTNPYKSAFLVDDDRLITENYILTGLDKTYFIEEFPDKVFEFKIFSLLGNRLTEVKRYGIQAYNDGVFNRAGLICDIEEKPKGTFTIIKHHTNDLPHKSLV